MSSQAHSVDDRCTHTVFHTEALETTSAQALVQRIKYRVLGQPVPAHFTAIPLVPSSLVKPELQGSTMPCSTRHNTANGTLKRGSQACIEFMCPDCCIASRDTAVKAGRLRMKCATHKADAIFFPNGKCSE